MGRGLDGLEYPAAEEETSTEDYKGSRHQSSCADNKSLFMTLRLGQAKCKLGLQVSHLLTCGSWNCRLARRLRPLVDEVGNSQQEQCSAPGGDASDDEHCL
eukprot:349396-Rhodomonas_salina.2